MNDSNLNNTGFSILLFQEGDRLTFKKVFDEFHVPLVFFADTILHNLPDAEDIVSNTFTKLWQLRANFDDPAKIKAFLYVACRNGCFDLLRRKKSRKGSLEVASDEIENLAVDTSVDDALRLEIMYVDFIKSLHDEISNLAPQMRSVAQMYFVNGLTTAQIAGKMGLAEQSVRNTKIHVIKRIKANLCARKTKLLRRLPLFGSHTFRS